jgi:hypothetical protein
VINRVLTDKDRELYKPIIEAMYREIPEMTGNKIASALVQQAFVYKATKETLISNCPMILSAGSYHDTAAELLRYYGYAVYDVDPVINCDLHTFRNRMPDNTYSTIISTSVLEHTTNDEEFVADVCKLLDFSGFGILTCDFKDDYHAGDPVPYTSNRFYTRHDLEVRLRGILQANNCDLVSEPDYTAKDTFVWDGINYSFATFVFQKGA